MSFGFMEWYSVAAVLVFLVGLGASLGLGINEETRAYCVLAALVNVLPYVPKWVGTGGGAGQHP